MIAIAVSCGKSSDELEEALKAVGETLGSLVPE